MKPQRVVAVADESEALDVPEATEAPASSEATETVEAPEPVGVPDSTETPAAPAPVAPDVPVVAPSQRRARHRADRAGNRRATGSSSFRVALPAH